MNTGRCLKHGLQSRWVLQNHCKVALKSQHMEAKEGVTAHQCAGSMLMLQVSGGNPPSGLPTWMMLPEEFPIL